MFFNIKSAFSYALSLDRLNLNTFIEFFLKGYQINYSKEFLNEYLENIFEWANAYLSLNKTDDAFESDVIKERIVAEIYNVLESLPRKSI